MTNPEALPDAVERARQYAAIFLNVGHDWHRYVPVDARVANGCVHVQGVQMWPEGDAWHIDDGGGGHWVCRAAPTAEATR